MSRRDLSWIGFEKKGRKAQATSKKRSNLPTSSTSTTQSVGGGWVLAPCAQFGVTQIDWRKIYDRLGGNVVGMRECFRVGFDWRFEKRNVGEAIY